MKKLLILLVSFLFLNESMAEMKFHLRGNINSTLDGYDCSKVNENGNILVGYKVRKWRWAKYSTADKLVNILRSNKGSRLGYPISILVYSNQEINEGNKATNCESLCKQFNAEYAKKLFESDQQIAMSNALNPVSYISKNFLVKILGSNGVNDFKWIDGRDNWGKDTKLNYYNKKCKAKGKVSWCRCFSEKYYNKAVSFDYDSL